MYWSNNSKKQKKIKKGFTLIELLVVVGILAVILSVTLIAINPAEQIGRARDLGAKMTGQDFANATVSYFTNEKKLPWTDNEDCKSEIDAGGYLADMPSCLNELVGGGLEESYLQKSELKEIYVNKCGDSAVLCYSPRSKIENEDAETRFSKFGVNQPGCPGKDKASTECYWCKPVLRTSSCSLPPAPTPTPTPTPTQLVPGYGNYETKLLRNYAVFFFDHPGFPPEWNIHISVRPDFGGNYTETNLFFTWTNDTSQTSQSIAYVDYRKLTTRYSAYKTVFGGTYLPSSSCGQTVYWRVANYMSLTDSEPNKKVGPTYTGRIDCNTRVGVIAPPLWFSDVYDYIKLQQKQYNSLWDLDKSGTIDWQDYWLAGFSTKMRAGGWNPPE